MTCKTCKYWIAPDKDEWDTVFKIVGECKAAAFHADMTEWVDSGSDTDDRIKAEYADFRMVVSDGSGYMARLHTKPDFYCACYEATP